MNRHRSQRRWQEKLPILARRESVAPSRDAGLQELIEQLPSRERTLVVEPAADSPIRSTRQVDESV